MSTINAEEWNRLTSFQQEAVSGLVKSYTKQNNKQPEVEVICFYLITEDEQKELSGGKNTMPQMRVGRD